MNRTSQMECREIVALLSDYLDGQSAQSVSHKWMSVVEVSAFEGHLTDCPGCQIIKVELTELKIAARELPLHTPPNALWTRVANIIAAEASPQQRPTREEFAPESFWDRLKARRFSFNLPQLVGAGALAAALLASSVYLFKPDAPAFTLTGAQAALLPEERELKADLDRRAAALDTRKANWSSQQRADFDAQIARIEASLKKCRQNLQSNTQDPIQRQMLRTLYDEKRLLLEDAERLK